MPNDKARSTRFTIPGSTPSSRSASPAPDADNYLAEYAAKRQFHTSDDEVSIDSAGNAYDTLLSPWRAAIRRFLLVCVQRESQIIANMQDRVRTPFLDAYFVYTSSLGTHTFFMIVLPMLFFFGFGEVGRGLLLVLALGVYTSSFVKDLICSPRPFAPPVTRLTIGTHHLEYGFPSTHSTNSASIALFLFSHVHRLASTFSEHSPLEPHISATTYWFFTALLIFYTFSIVYGRLYTAMHSFTDCVVGVSMGALLWYIFDGWFGLGLHPWIEKWLATSGWEVPAILVPWCLLIVHKHPQPVDDCPCFEDAIAFMSVVLGGLISRWAAVMLGLPEEARKKMPGSSWATWEDKTVWWTLAGVKMIFGILTIFIWRIIAKSLLHLILPPVFRVLSKAFVLPHRRFYTPATHYKNVPNELNGLRAVPSVIDLPTAGVGEEFDSEISNVAANNGQSEVTGIKGGRLESEIKLRGNGNVADTVSEKVTWDGSSRGKEGVRHYDADVLTKVIVYCGIALLAADMLPAMFDVLGWGVSV